MIRSRARRRVGRDIVRRCCTAGPSYDMRYIRVAAAAGDGEAVESVAERERTPFV